MKTPKRITAEEIATIVAAARNGEMASAIARRLNRPTNTVHWVARRARTPFRYQVRRRKKRSALLATIETLHRAHGAPACSVHNLAAQSGLARSTVVFLLASLIDAGAVARRAETSPVYRVYYVPTGQTVSLDALDAARDMLRRQGPVAESLDEDPGVMAEGFGIRVPRKKMRRFVDAGMRELARAALRRRGRCDEARAIAP